MSGDLHERSDSAFMRFDGSVRFHFGGYFYRNSNLLNLVISSRPLYDQIFSKYFSVNTIRQTDDSHTVHERAFVHIIERFAPHAPGERPALDLQAFQSPVQTVWLPFSTFHTFKNGCLYRSAIDKNSFLLIAIRTAISEIVRTTCFEPAESGTAFCRL